MRIEEMVTVVHCDGSGVDAIVAYCVMLRVCGEQRRLHVSATLDGAHRARLQILDELKEAVAYSMADDYADMASAVWKD